MIFDTDETYKHFLNNLDNIIVDYHYLKQEIIEPILKYELFTFSSSTNLKTLIEKLQFYYPSIHLQPLGSEFKSLDKIKNGAVVIDFNILSHSKIGYTVRKAEDYFLKRLQNNLICLEKIGFNLNTLSTHEFSELRKFFKEVRK